MRYIIPHHAVGEPESGYRHVAIVGDDYVPFDRESWPLQLSSTLSAQRYRSTDDTDKPDGQTDPNWDDPKEIEKRDKPVKPSIQPIFIPAGKGIEVLGKVLFKVGTTAAGWAARKLDSISNRSQQKAVTRKAIRDSMDAHADRMRNPRERASEQSAIDRREHKERAGDETMIA